MNATSELIHSIQKNLPIGFVKFGDGEINCITGECGQNCDRDSYTINLKNGLINSVKYYTNDTDFLIGKWTSARFKALEDYTAKPIRWAHYWTVMFSGNEYDLTKAELLKAIKESRRKKIVICNKLLEKTKILFNTTDVIFVNFNNWFDSDFAKVLFKSIELIGEEDGNHIIITCAGMGSKVLIAELHKIYPKNIYLDYGSALDKLCTKHETRGWSYSYEYLIDLCKDFLPDDWNDPKYDHIYEEAKERLGMHLR